MTALKIPAPSSRLKASNYQQPPTDEDEGVLTFLIKNFGAPAGGTLGEDFTWDGTDHSQQPAFTPQAVTLDLSNCPVDVLFKYGKQGQIAMGFPAGKITTRQLPALPTDSDVFFEVIGDSTRMFQIGGEGAFAYGCAILVTLYNFPMYPDSYYPAAQEIYTSVQLALGNAVPVVNAKAGAIRISKAWVVYEQEATVAGLYTLLLLSGSGPLNAGTIAVGTFNFRLVPNGQPEDVWIVGKNFIRTPIIIPGVGGAGVALSINLGPPAGGLNIAPVLHLVYSAVPLVGA